MYEIFTKKVVRSGSPTIAFSKIGQLHFNQTAARILQKDSIEYVLLLWDADAKQIAVKTTSNKKDPRAYHIRYAAQGNGAGFSAKTFFDHIGLDYTERKNIPIEIDTNKELLLEVKVPEAFFKKKLQPKLMDKSKAG